MPSVFDDEYIEGRGDDSQPSRLSPSKLATRHHIRIRRLQSEVHNRLYSAAVPDEPPPQTWFDSVQSRLDQWREDWPAPTSFVSEEWLNLNYHMTVTLLLRPTAANPNPDRSQTQTALDSSSQVMRFYKDMFRKGRINYSRSCCILCRCDRMLIAFLVGLNRLGCDVPALHQRRDLPEWVVASASQWMEHRADARGRVAGYTRLLIYHRSVGRYVSCAQHDVTQVEVLMKLLSHHPG